jgi:hypothetical protein
VDTTTHPFCANGHLWTKGTGFPTVGERVERNLKEHLPGRWVDFVGCLVGPLLFNLGLNKGGLSLLVSFVDTLLRTGKGGYNDAITGPRGFERGA